MSMPMRKSTSQSQQSNPTSSPALSLHKRLPSATSTPTLNQNNNNNNNNNNYLNLSSFNAAAAPHSSRPSTPAAATIGGSFGATAPMSSTPKSHAMAKSVSTGAKSFGSPAAASQASQASPLTNHSIRSPAVSSSLQHAAVTAAAAGRSTSAAPASTPTPAGAVNAPSTGPTHQSMNFDSPSGLSSFMQGLEGGAGMALSLSNLGLNMALSASNGPIGSNMGRAQDDAERRRRLELVLDTLKQRPGRISREALERLGRRCEMDVVPEGPDKLSLGGRNSVVLDVEFVPDQSSVVDRIALSFPSASDAMSDHLAKASRILHKDLTPPDGVAAINATLDRFADNLERLATLDKLSTPGADCFEAIIGVYTSLRRLYEHERSAAEQLFGAKGDASRAKEAAQREVMCRKSGKPEMHARRRVGLSLQFWRDEHLIPSSISADTGDEMEIDGAEAAGHPGKDEDEYEDEQTVYSLTIECEPSPSTLYPPMRVSSDWVSPSITKSADAFTTEEPGPSGSKEGEIVVVDWQEPDEAVLLKREPMDSTNGAAPPMQVQSRFIARFEPALVLPIQAAMQVYSSFGLHWPPEALSASSTGPFDQLVLGPVPDADMLDLSASLRPHQYRTFRKTFSSFAATDGPAEECTYQMGLYTPRIADMSLSIAVESLPFAHPRQLIEALPLFRQYAFTASLLKRSFASTSGKPDRRDDVPSMEGNVGSGATIPSVDGVNVRIGDQEEDGDDDSDEEAVEEELDRLLSDNKRVTAATKAAKRTSSSTGTSERKLDVLFNLHSIRSHTKPPSSAIGGGGNAAERQQQQQQQCEVQPHFTIMRGARKALVSIGLNGKLEVPSQNIVLAQTSRVTASGRGRASAATAAAAGGGAGANAAREVQDEEAAEEEEDEDEETAMQIDSHASTTTGSSSSQAAAIIADKLTRGLEVAEDFAVWCEWLSSSSSSGAAAAAAA